MKIIGKEFLESHLKGDIYQIKMVFNDYGAIFGPISTEHKYLKDDGISYEENYKGNAMAAMIYDGKIDIRFHNNYNDTAVRRIITNFFKNELLKDLLKYKVYYQGRMIDML